MHTDSEAIIKWGIPSRGSSTLNGRDMIAPMSGFPKRTADTSPYGTVLYRVNAETALLLGGARALLMQLALPGVAAGVDEHSDFRSRPLRRLWRTLTLTYRLAFGAEAEVREA